MSAPANRAFFAIQYGSGDAWLNQFNDLGSRTLCQIFTEQAEAEAHLATRRFRPGFREGMAVRELSPADLRAMSNDVAECMACAERHDASLADRLMWRARLDLLVSYQPLAA